MGSEKEEREGGGIALVTIARAGEDAVRGGYQREGVRGFRPLIQGGRQRGAPEGDARGGCQWVEAPRFRNQSLFLPGCMPMRPD